MADATRLAERLDVAPEWRHAVEIVLGFHLQAVCVDELSDLATSLQTLTKGTLTLFDTTIKTTPNRPEDYAERLISRVSSPWPLDDLLGSIYLAEDLDHAFKLREELSEQESIITREGIWVGRNWLCMAQEQDEKSGVLARGDELRQITAELRQLGDEVEQLTADFEQGQAQLKEIEQSREQIQRQLNEANRRQADIGAAQGSKRAKADHLSIRREAIGREIAEVRSQISSDKKELNSAKISLHSALSKIETLAQQRQLLIQQRDELRTTLLEKREEASCRQSEVHKLALKIEAVRSSSRSLTQGLERMTTQLSQLSKRQEELKLHLTKSIDPLAEQNQQLEQQLEQRIKVEEQLTKARKVLEEIEQRLRQLEQDRHQSEQAVQSVRTILDQARMSRQEVLIRGKTLEEQLNETGFNRNQLIEGLAEDASEEQSHEQVERMDMRIRRLGAINLAAIDEFQEQSERMEYLDSQHADVTESLETLERAIRKIDKETRTRFKETFDKVNTGIQDMFPKLFGGGHAYLELTGDDLLDTGVTVMARPPGKRNSSIQLLSGGEKALTAVALVFSIFKLNPAPFCMLDEVDAPLDDANVGRFCELVKTMSEHVQFIFITHNKITMEIAHQLMGVTMNEPGVSRLVSVDVEEAAQLAVM